ncbi:MAG: FAD-binding oxidoreductase [Chloroflexota bacterium]|nr:FAD-binding oxidoreductase [Chloroflexota bacterium]
MAGFEVVVVGSGVAGGSTAYHVARQGRNVLVVERAKPATEPAASWASAGGVRRQGRHAAEAMLASESIARWPLLEAELGADVGYLQGGNLKVAEGDREAEQIAEFVDEQQANGFADVRLLDRKEALAIVPGLSDTVTAASYSPQDGQADPPLTTRAYANAAQRHGATYWNDTTTLGLLVEGQRVVGVRTSRGDVRADAVVLAAGVWSDEIARTAGIGLPMRTRAPQMLLSSAAPPGTLRPVIGTTGRRLSLKQLRDGEFMLGGGWPGITSGDRRSYTMLDSSVEGGWAAALAILPAVGEQRIIRKWCGLEAETFDQIPLIGPWPGVDGLIIATGFSGHGFAISPAVGRCIADQLAGRPTPELAGLDPSRVASFDRLAVERYVNDRSEASLAVG